MMMTEEPAVSAFCELAERVMACRMCPRLTAWREKVAREKRRAFREQEYWGRGVPGFGDPQARVLVVGLAPGAHGSNRTGRMFTGDSSGDFLYAALHRVGFANQPFSKDLSDGLALRDVYISAVCRCVPPDNKPERSEIENCQPFLLEEMTLLNHIRGIVALGALAYERVQAIYRSQGHLIPKLDFGHGVFTRLGEALPWLLASYHPSRQNTQTGRLTVGMFSQIWQTALDLLEV